MVVAVMRVVRSEPARSASHRHSGAPLTAEQRALEHLQLIVVLAVLVSLAAADQTRWSRTLRTTRTCA